MNAYTLICGCFFPLLIAWIVKTLAEIVMGGGESRPKEKRKPKNDEWTDLDYILDLTMMKDDRK